MYCIPLQSIFFLLYNDTLFVTITSFRAEILPFRGDRVRKLMCQIGVITTQSMVETLSFSKINRTSQMITSINATVDWSVTLRFGTFTSRSHHLVKVISQL